jgi:PEP-CTERM motif
MQSIFLGLHGGQNMKTLIAVFALALLAGTAKADSVSTWNYQGNVNNYGGMFFNPGPGGVAPPGDELPNPCNCALTGSVTLDNGNPVSWSFAAAGITWNTNNSSFTEFYDNLADQSPLFTLWNLSLVDTSGDTLFTRFTTFSMLSAFDFSSNGLIVQGDPGAWVDHVSTPEPGTFALLGVGLALAALCGKYLL